MALRVRRVITGHDDHGKAVVKIDEVCQHTFTGRPGAVGVNVWTSEGFPASNDGDVDAGKRPGDEPVLLRVGINLVRIANQNPQRHVKESQGAGGRHVDRAPDGPADIPFDGCHLESWLPLAR